MSRIGGTSPIMNADGTETILLTTAAIGYSHSFDLSKGVAFGLFIGATSVLGTPSVKVELQESYRRPTTEGAADGAWVVPDGKSALIDNMNDQEPHVVTVNPVPMTYGRLKLTGLSGHADDSLVTARLFQQDEA